MEKRKINREDNKIKNYPTNLIKDEDRRLRNELSSINPKSTFQTLIKKDKNSNFMESNNLISTNYSLSNHLTNFSNINNSSSLFRTINKNSIYGKKNISKVDDNISKNNTTNLTKLNPKSKKTSSSPSKRKLDFRLKPKPEIPPKKKRKLVLNAYKNIDRIMKIINNSENLKSNENLCKHFRNISYKKRIDDLTNKLLIINKLTIQDYEDMNLEDI